MTSCVLMPKCEITTILSALNAVRFLIFSWTKIKFLPKLATQELCRRDFRCLKFKRTFGDCVKIAPNMALRQAQGPQFIFRDRSSSSGTALHFQGHRLSLRAQRGNPLMKNAFKFVDCHVAALLAMTKLICSSQ